MRDSISHRKIARTDADKLKEALYKPGDVIVTKGKVRCLDNRGKRDGYALPGWKWRVVKVIVVRTEAAAMFLAYECVAHDAPKMYNCTLKELQIFDCVGRHEGELLGSKR